ncbi:hypothetical protein pb186bvf_003354 [Paramecium bursaria]
MSDLGLGAIKFQSVVANEISQNNNKGAFQQLEKLIIEPRTSIKPISTRKQFQEAKKKIVEKLNDPGERKTFEEGLKKLEEKKQQFTHDEQLKLIQLQIQKQENNFRLQVSSSSGSFTSSESEFDDASKFKITHEINDQQAIHAARSILTSKFSTQQTVKNIPTKKNLNTNEAKSIFNNQGSKLFMMRQQQTKAQGIRKEVQYLKSLYQNQDLVNNDNLQLNEYKIENEIHIDMDCKDMITFMRFQHELDELKRKQMDFKNQKQNHLETIRKSDNNTTIDSPQVKKKEDNKFMAVLMAKQLFKNWKSKREPKPADQEAVTEKRLHSPPKVDILRSAQKIQIIKSPIQSAKNLQKQ